jgi:hypothetical protein
MLDLPLDRDELRDATAPVLKMIKTSTHPAELPGLKRNPFRLGRMPLILGTDIPYVAWPHRRNRNQQSLIAITGILKTLPSSEAGSLNRECLVCRPYVHNQKICRRRLQCLNKQSLASANRLELPTAQNKFFTVHRQIAIMQSDKNHPLT